MLDNYEKFILEKMKINRSFGFDVPENEINPIAKPHQRDIIRWALCGGRRAIFAAFGLGKSIIQLEILRIIGKREGGRQLIVCPLGVRQEFTKKDGPLIGLDDIRFVRRNKELSGPGIYITNYESIRDGRLSVDHFNAVSLDEASVLRSFGSKTYQTFLDLFSGVKYRFVATATPSPNRFKELLHYAGFLGIMDTGQSLTRFFKRDSTRANNLQIHPHKENEFWLWVSSWAVFITKPSDLGYPDDGYLLPELHVHCHEVDREPVQQVDSWGQVAMFPDTTLSVTSASREKRDSISDRIDEMLRIIAEHPDENIVLWHDQEAERHAIKKALPEAVEVYGSQDLETRERRVIDFSDGNIKYLATKPILSGSGCNFQRHCRREIFMGIGFKFNDFIQSVHRVYRFLQGKECHIHLIFTPAERRVLEILETKWKQHEEMVSKMTEIIKKHGLAAIDMAKELQRAVGVERVEITGNGWAAVNNDTVREARRMADCSVHLIHTSIPFSNHYEYTPNYCDMGHTEDNVHFWEQMDFLTPELLRVLQPGRVYACHVKDRILFGNVTGAGIPTVSPFHAECLFHGLKHGFDYMGMITVVTDVVRENNQTYRLGWTEQCKDGSKMGVGSPEYILLFHKPQTDRSKGYADDPVTKSKDDYSRARWQVDAHAFWRSSGNRLLTLNELAELGPAALSKRFTEESLRQVYDYESHVMIGESLELRGVLPSSFMAIAPGSHSPQVWHDVNRMRTLNGEQTRRGLNNHICPLQFDIVDRIIRRYSNPGETVYDPFAGLMTVPLRAVKMGRIGRGTELNPDYFSDGVDYLRMQDRSGEQVSLLDAIEEAA